MNLKKLFNLFIYLIFSCQIDNVCRNRILVFFKLLFPTLLTVSINY